MKGVVRLIYQGDYRAYDFAIMRDGNDYVAICPIKNLGGINTTAPTIEKLVGTMIPDAVHTWEHK